MRLKPSHYNHFFPLKDNNVLAYNALSNSFARVTKTQYRLIREIFKDPAQYNFDTEEKEKLREDLRVGSFLIDEDLDEIEFLKMRNRIGRFSTDYVGLTIAPTLDCNFSCEYCFEEARKGDMSQEVEDALLKLVEDKLKSARGLSVVWFGGEPLLKIDIIERITKKFKALCQDKSVDYSPQEVITNGYLLTRENALKLKELNVTNAQITIDGPPDIHDKRRKLKGGQGSFDQILKNIKESMDVINIIVRINVDEENVDQLDRLYDIFENNGLSGKVPFYLGRVFNTTEACADISSKCFSIKDFSSVIVDSVKRNMKTRPYSQFPVLNHFGVCCADKFNSFVVTPSGDLFKCWSEITFEKDRSIGNLVEDHMNARHINNLAGYLNWDPFTDKKCVKCKYLPICGGGCPYFSLNDMEKCTTWKYHLKEMLKLQYEEMNKPKN